MAREMIVESYNEDWSLLFEVEKTLLKSIFGCTALDILHFGSTAIKGLSAKPIIDIMITVSNINDIDKFNEDMAKNGYTSKGENGIPQRRYFFKYKEDGENHSHHIHIYELDNSHVADELMFRDYLSIDKDALREYEMTKLAASEKYRFSPNEYVDAKTECVNGIMVKAKEYYRKNKII